MFLAAVLTLVSGNARAQTAVCSSTPGEGERIECTQDATSNNDTSITPLGIDIDTTDNNIPGVYAQHEGSGDIFIDLQTGLDETGRALIRNVIDTMGDHAPGIYGRHEGSGNIEIGVQQGYITTTGESSPGILAYTGYRPSNPQEPDSPPEAAGNINIVVSGSTIETAARNSSGIIAENYGGEGWIEVRVSNSTITTNGSNSYGIFGLRGGTATGDVNIIVDNTGIETEGSSAHGVYGRANSGVPNLMIDVDRGRITTAGRSAYGVRGYRQGNDGIVDIDVVDTTITTTGDRARGVDAYVFDSNGDIDIFVEDSHITTMGAERAPGVRARFQDATPATPTSDGDIRVNVRGGSITTHGAANRVGNDDSGAANTASGLEITHEGDTGDITIDVRDLEITTEGTAVNTDQIGTLSHGIYSRHDGSGDIDIDARGGFIKTKGSFSYGIYGTHAGDGDITIGTRDGHTITTTGDNAHGIVAYHFGTENSRTMEVTVNGMVETRGAGANGVQVGALDSNGDPERIAGLDAEGYLRQTVTVNGSVQGGSGDAAGIFMGIIQQTSQNSLTI